MRPNPTFHWEDRKAMLAFLQQEAFLTIVLASAGGRRIVHAPVLVRATDRLQFHLARRNAGADAVEGSEVLFSVLGTHFYVSPDWYGTPDRVPTWHYVGVEGEGRLRRLDDAELTLLLDDLSAANETQLLPKTPWTRAKMSAGRFEAMTKAVAGFEIAITGLRGTCKMGQDKSDSERTGVAAALRDLGHAPLAELMERGIQ